MVKRLCNQRSMTTATMSKMAIILIQPKAIVNLKPLAQLKILKYLRYPICIHCHDKLTTNHSVLDTESIES